MQKRQNKEESIKLRKQRLIDFIETLDKQDSKVRKLVLMYLIGFIRNKKTYSIKELAIYWSVDEETVRDILIEVLPKL